MTSTPAAVCTDREDACGYADPRPAPRLHHRPLGAQRPTRGIPRRDGHSPAGSGGTGTGYTFRMLSNIAGSVVGQTTGTYTAGSIDGESDIIAVSDSGGNTASPDHSDQKLTPHSGGGQRPTTRQHHSVSKRRRRRTVPIHAHRQCLGGAVLCRLDRWCVRRRALSGTDTITVSDAYNGSQTVNIVVTAGVSITEPPNPGRTGSARDRRRSSLRRAAATPASSGRSPAWT